MTVDLATLNASQRDAAAWQNGPLLVLAGPGSGKTRVLTYRIARLIEQAADARFRVLGVTFTNKAASEMRSRIDHLLTDGRERAHLTTFHSFAAEILRQHGAHVGLRPDFGIISETVDREAMLKDAIRESGTSDPGFMPAPAQLLPAVNRMLDECVAPERAAEWLGNRPNAPAVAIIYRQYWARLIRANQLDYGSLLAMAVSLLESTPAIARQLQKVYPYVCVDEFQDTNLAQFRLLAQLVPESQPNLFVVADDDQIIYEWNGASPMRLRELRERFSMSVIQLPENYRCPPEVIALANNLIRHNHDRAAEKQALTAHKQPGGSNRVTLAQFDDFGQEVEWLAQQVRQMPEAERSQCVILARRRKLLELAARALGDNNIPAHVAVRRNEFQSVPFRWLHSMLRLANARNDREQLRRTCSAFYQLDGTSIEADDVVAQAAVAGSDLLRAWIGFASEQGSLESTSRAMLARTASTLLEHLDYRAFVEAAFVWFQAVRSARSGAAQEAFDEFADEAEIWASLTGEISTQHGADLTLHAFLQELDLRAKEMPPPPDAVRCLTIHASKGTEFRHVFLIGLAEDELPSWAAIRRGPQSKEMQEERRNCFVAITRAEETLTLTASRQYMGYPKRPSRFLSEMGLLQA